MISPLLLKISLFIMVYLWTVVGFIYAAVKCKVSYSRMNLLRLFLLALITTSALFALFSG